MISLSNSQPFFAPSLFLSFQLVNCIQYVMHHFVAFVGHHARGRDGNLSNLVRL
ncbi:hypothetical protein DER44DRAFT_904031 [Fusarium oxysporum]|nr:hypothetical protein DER44DRAFT_904031 [Fusarium oxysporum]